MSSSNPFATSSIISTIKGIDYDETYKDLQLLVWENNIFIYYYKIGFDLTNEEKKNIFKLYPVIKKENNNYCYFLIVKGINNAAFFYLRIKCDNKKIIKLDCSKIIHKDNLYIYIYIYLSKKRLELLKKPNEFFKEQTYIETQPRGRNGSFIVELLARDKDVMNIQLNCGMYYIKRDKTGKFDLLTTGFDLSKKNVTGKIIKDNINKFTNNFDIKTKYIIFYINDKLILCNNITFGNATQYILQNNLPPYDKLKIVSLSKENKKYNSGLKMQVLKLNKQECESLLRTNCFFIIRNSRNIIFVDEIKVEEDNKITYITIDKLKPDVFGPNLLVYIKDKFYVIGTFIDNINDKLRYMIFDIDKFEFYNEEGEQNNNIKKYFIDYNELLERDEEKFKKVKEKLDIKLLPPPPPGPIVGGLSKTTSFSGTRKIRHNSMKCDNHHELCNAVSLIKSKINSSKFNYIPTQFPKLTKTRRNIKTVISSENPSKKVEEKKVEEKKVD